MPLPLPTQYVEKPTLWEELTEDEKHYAYYAQIYAELKEQRRNDINKTRIVEEWDSVPRGDTLAYNPVGETVTTLTPPKDYHSDVVIESITATWTVSGTTSAQLTLGNMVFTFPPAQGVVNLVGLNIRLEYEDDRIFRVAPAAACSILLCGYADFARPGNRGGQRG